MDLSVKCSLSSFEAYFLEAPIEATDEVALIPKETMEEVGIAFLKTVPVEAEVVIVDSGAEK